MDRRSPQNIPYHGDLDPSNALFLGPIQAHNPNGILIGSIVLAQITAVSLYFTKDTLHNCPFLRGEGVDSHLMVPWAHSSPQPKRHLDRFSHFCRAHYYDKQTTLFGL